MLPYKVYEPGLGARTSDRLLVYLHGIGDRGRSLAELEEGWGLPRLLAQGMVLPFPVVAPVCPAGDIWRPDLVLAFLQELRPSWPARKIILCGYSLGATGVYSFQSTYLDHITAGVVVAGRITTFDAGNLAKVPLYAIYGDLDERFTGSDIENRLERIRQMGGRTWLKVLQGKGHFISDEALTLPDLHEWVASI